MGSSPIFSLEPRINNSPSHTLTLQSRNRTCANPASSCPATLNLNFRTANPSIHSDRVSLTYMQQWDAFICSWCFRPFPAKIHYLRGKFPRWSRMICRWQWTRSLCQIHPKPMWPSYESTQAASKHASHEIRWYSSYMSRTWYCSGCFFGSSQERAYTWQCFSGRGVDSSPVWDGAWLSDIWHTLNEVERGYIKSQCLNRINALRQVAVGIVDAGITLT